MTSIACARFPGSSFVENPDSVPVLSLERIIFAELDLDNSQQHVQVEGATPWIKPCMAGSIYQAAASGTRLLPLPSFDRPPWSAMAPLPLYVLLLPLLAILPLVFLSHSRRRAGLALRLPPSPWALPVIGHLHHLARELPQRAMRDLARRHGPLLLLRLGRLPVVVASSADAAREVMVSRDVDFASRHMSRMVRMSISPGAEGIIWAPYSDEWRQLRKICTVELFSARRVRSFRPVREEEAGRLLRAVAAASRGATVNLSELLTAYAADSSAFILLMCREGKTELRSIRRAYAG